MCQNYEVERLQLCNILVVSVSAGSYRDTAVLELHQVTFPKQWQAHKHHKSALQLHRNASAASSCPQGQREPQQSPVSAHCASAPSKEWTTNNLWRAGRDELLLGKSLNLVNLPLFKLKNHLLLHKSQETQMEKTKWWELSAHPLNMLRLLAVVGSADQWVLPAHWSSQLHFQLCRAAGSLPMPTAPLRVGWPSKEGARCHWKASPSSTSHRGTNVRNILLLNSAVSYRP